MTEFRSHPDPSQWDDYVDYESTSWPKKDRRRYWIIPSICFNCESACGILAYVDKDTLDVRKIEGNPVHPGSRGRTCAKGVVTPNQLEDPDRILYPMRRAGERGEGRWQQVSWDEALEDIGGRIRKAILENRRHELMYHVGRPGEDGYANRVLQAWGVDGHNSHTNVCSSSARLGHFLWCGADRPSPDYANAQTILLLSSHLETGHYFNPHAQRIIESKAKGGTLICIDPRLSNSSAKADLWLPAYSGTEGALLLAIARILIEEDLFNREFVRKWVNWRQYLEAERPDLPQTFDGFVTALKELYGQFTPEYAEAETGVRAAQIVEAARAIGRAGTRFATHNWRAAASGNLWGWQITRCLYLLVVLTGSLGAVGGVNMHVTNKFVPKHPNPPPPPDYWNELLFPKEFPLAFFEMSFLLPHFLKEQRGRLDVYFTRVYNPLWTNPDGFSWMEVLQDKEKIGLHVALTPTWSETAWFADYILPMGLGTERHDTMSQETHAGQWLGFRQPVLRVAREKRGEHITATYQANPGEVWEEAEFWIALSWKIDPSGELGIRRFFESPYRSGEQITVEEYYRWMFENSVPGLPEAAAKENLTPLEYMRKYGVFKVSDKAYSRAFENPLEDAALEGTTRDGRENAILKNGARVGVTVDGVDVPGFNTPSRLLEFYSPTMVQWGVARARRASIRAGARALARPEARRGRVRSPAELPPADADPHALAGEMAVRDLPQQSAVDLHRRRARPGHRHGRSRQGHHPDRVFRHAGVGDRGDPPRRAGHVAPPRALAIERGHRRAARRLGARADPPRARRPLRDEAGPRRGTVREQRPRQRPDLVERGGRPPEPDLPGAARPGQRHALLAPAGPPREGGTRRRLRRHRRGHGKGPRGLQGMDGPDPSARAATRGAPAAPVVRQAAPPGAGSV